MLHVVIRGTPAPKGSLRHVGRGVLVESSARLRPWRAAVTAAAVDAAGPGWEPIDGPIHVEVGFEFARPASHYGTGRNTARLRPGAPAYPATRPDLDKLVRAVLDALGDAGVWRDDARVVTVAAVKRWAPVPGCWIRLGWDE